MRLDDCMQILRRAIPTLNWTILWAHIQMMMTGRDRTEQDNDAASSRSSMIGQQENICMQPKILSFGPISFYFDHDETTSLDDDMQNNNISESYIIGVLLLCSKIC